MSSTNLTVKHMPQFPTKPLHKEANPSDLAYHKSTDLKKTNFSDSTNEPKDSILIELP